MTVLDDRHESPGWRILIAGTGGQGVLTAARLLCECFVEQGRDVVSGQLHGMAQRGGAVQSCVMIDAGISPVIPSGRADFVLGFEPVETVRSLSFMSSRTLVFMNTTPVIPFVMAQRTVLGGSGAEYPNVQDLSGSIRAVSPQTFTFDAMQCAVQAGSAQSLNMVMLGCLLGSGSLPCTADVFWKLAVKRMPSALQETNTQAFAQGAEVAKGLQVSGGTLRS